MRRTPAAPARASASNACSGEDVSGNEGAPAAPPAPKTPPTHSLWMLSRKFVRLLLTTQVQIYHLKSDKKSVHVHTYLGNLSLLLRMDRVQ